MPTNNINFTLLITDRQGLTVESIDIMNQTSDIDIKSSKILNKIVNGSYEYGIQQGINAVESGAKVTFTIPLFLYKDKGVQDITEYWKTILNNSREYRYYLVRMQSNRMYKREMIPTDNLGYKSSFYTNAGNAKLSFIFIDNFYVGDTVFDNISEFSNITEGSYERVYESITRIQTLSRFKITIGNATPIYYIFNFYSLTGTGIGFIGDLPSNAILLFDGINLVLENTNVVVYHTGISPDLLYGETTLFFDTSHSVNNFELSYNPRVDF
ncbi:MAG: hypothetical protein ACRC31_04400 [Cetobacterium sp.]